MLLLFFDFSFFKKKLKRWEHWYWTSCEKISNFQIYEVFWFLQTGLNPNRYVRAGLTGHYLTRHWRIMTRKYPWKNQVGMLLIITHIPSYHGSQFHYIRNIYYLFSFPRLHVGFFWNFEILFTLVSGIKTLKKCKGSLMTWNCLLRFIDVVFENY